MLDPAAFNSYDRAWIKLGACHNHPHPGWWFSHDRKERAYAKHVCQRCPVRIECRNEAYAREEMYGIWGGEGERARRRALRVRGAA